MAEKREGQRPEALAEFAETARKQQHQKDAVRKPMEADEHTVPVPEDNADKHDAATRLLHEGATGEKDGGGADEAALRETKDRIRDSR
jgi:hypothetical protein